jgi:membrane protein DedA with SNARE-associated domain
MDAAAALTQFLDTYGLLAVFLIMLLKEIGVPVPIPADIIILGGAARAAQGKESGIAVFLVILIPMVIGGFVQYAVVRGPGRQFIYRVGR